jgi:methanogenic corrinoid protein MtbC1
MRDSRHDGRGGRGGDTLSPLARTVMQKLVTQADRGPGKALARLPGKSPGKSDDHTILELCEAALARDPVHLAATVGRLWRERGGEAALIDRYLPGAARKFGCDWLDDALSFAEVTIGTARLQGALRRVTAVLPVPGLDDPGAPDPGLALLVLPEGEQHGFGVQVLAAQLRRRGLRVCLQLGQTAETLHRSVQEGQFDLAMISVGSEAGLASAAAAVQAVRTGSRGSLPVAVGGAALAVRADLCRALGADIATGDANEALAFARAVVAETGAQDGRAPGAGAAEQRLEAT